MIEKITHSESLIALIIYNNYDQEGIKYFSPWEHPLQLGFMKRPAGYKVDAHIHNPVKKVASVTQEVLFIKKGRVRIDFYASDRSFLESRKLSAGDVVLLASGGHGLEVMEEAVIVEVKNGPFVEGADKTRFETGKEK